MTRSINRRTALAPAVVLAVALGVLTACGGDTADSSATAGTNASSPAAASSAGGAELLSKDCRKLGDLMQEGAGLLAEQSPDVHRQFANKVRTEAASFEDQAVKDVASAVAQYYDQHAAYRANPSSAKTPDSKLLSEAGLSYVKACGQG